MIQALMVVTLRLNLLCLKIFNMPITLNIKFDGTAITKRLNTISKGMKDFKEPLEDTGKDLVEFFGNKVFQTQGKALGENWKPLSAATLKMRAERRGHYANNPIEINKILIWTGALKGGIKKTVDKVKLTIENTVDYFKFNQPKRKMLGINREVIDIVIKNFEKYLNKLVNK